MKLEVPPKCGEVKGATSEEQRGLLTSAILINVYTLENNHILALSLHTADMEKMLLSGFTMEKAVIMMAVIVSARADFNLLHDSGSHPF